MKRTQLKDALRNIWKQKVSFLSIVVIATLGVTIFLGIDYSVYAIRRDGTVFYTNTHFHDIEVLSTLLLSEDDLDAIRRTEGISDVEGMYLTGAKAVSQGIRTDVNIISLTERINLPIVLEGRLPANEHECAVEPQLMEQMGWHTGDVVTVTNASDGKPEYLKSTTFELCGSILHPDHTNRSIPERPYIVVTRGAFDTEALNGCFMKAEVMTARQAELNRFEDPYRTVLKSADQQLEALAQARAPIQETSVKNYANDLLSENRQKLAEAEQELADGRRELDEGYEALADGERQYAEGAQELEDARAELDDAKQQLIDAEAELKSGREELDAAKAQLDEGAAELDAGEKKLNSARRQLVSGWNTIEDAKTQIRGKLKSALDDLVGEDSAQWIAWASPTEANPNSSDVTAGDFRITDSLKVTLGASLSGKIGSILTSVGIPDDMLQKVYAQLGGEGEYDRDAALQLLSDRLASIAGKYQEDYDALADGCTQWDAGHQQYLNGLRQYRAALAQYNEGLAAYEEGEAQYAEGLQKYEEGLQAYNDGEAAYEQGLKDIEAAREQLDEAKQKLSDGEAQYAEGLQKYEDGKAQLFEAEEQVASLGTCKWIVLDAYGNAGFTQLGMAANNLKSLEMTFALLFVIVGALVIYATVSKMVDEQRQLVGTTKALGFFNREIFVKYLLFGVSATLIGCVLGTVLGRFAVQSVVLSGYTPYFEVDISKPAMVVLPTVIVFAAAVLLAVLAVWPACVRMLRAPAVRLMQATVPQGRSKAASGGRKARSLYSRLILLNIRSDLRRVLVTVVSVAGCCALVVIGVTLRNSVRNTLKLQLTEVIHYDGKVLFDPTADAETSERVGAAIGQADVSACPITRTDITVRIRNIDFQELYIGDLSRIGEHFILRDAHTNELLSPSDDGILVSKRLSENYDLRVGDLVEIALNGTETAQVPIAGIFNNYIGRETFMSDGCFRNLYGKDAEINAYMIRADGASLDPMLEALGRIKGFESFQRADSFKELFNSATGVLDMIVLLFIFIAAIMAGVVLMNLTNIYIMQKKRELTIMRINGFTVKEGIAYVLRETVVTTAAGIVLGIGLGTGIGYNIVLSLEQSFMQFDRRVSVGAWLVGAVITIVFAVIVNAIALRKVKKLKLTDLS